MLCLWRRSARPASVAKRDESDRRLRPHDLSRAGDSRLSQSAADDQLFRDKVAPVLERRCVHCHGERAPKGNLSLTTSAGALKGGDSGPAVVPGKPDESLLLEMISGDQPAMPQKEKPLSRDEVAAIRRWIETRRSWPAGLTLSDRRFEGQSGGRSSRSMRPEPPAITIAWVRTPIDAFILAELRSARARAQPRGRSPHVDPPPHVRPDRLAADARGDRRDSSTIARQTPTRALVDRLLASPHYGERWGRHWLDVVHYGDTHGYDKDKRREQRLAVSRLRDRGLQRRPSLRPVHPRASRRRCARAGRPAGVIATGFIAAGPWDFVGHVELREGTDRQAQDPAARPRRHGLEHDVHLRQPDGPLRPLPRSQVRPDPPSRLLPPAGGLRRRRSRRPAYTRSAGEPRRALSRAATWSTRSNRTHRGRSRVLRRGEVDQPGETVGPGRPGVRALALSDVRPCRNPDDEGSRRAALADWLASPTQRPDLAFDRQSRSGTITSAAASSRRPTTSAATARCPTHPELLDWLAADAARSTASRSRPSIA